MLLYVDPIQAHYDPFVICSGTTFRQQYPDMLIGMRVCISDLGTVILPFSIQRLSTNKLIYCETCNYDINTLDACVLAFKHAVTDRLVTERKMWYFVEHPNSESARVVIAYLDERTALVAPAFIFSNTLQVPIATTHLVLQYSTMKSMLIHFERIECKAAPQHSMECVQLGSLQVHETLQCLYTLFE